MTIWVLCGAPFVVILLSHSSLKTHNFLKLSYFHLSSLSKNFQEILYLAGFSRHLVPEICLAEVKCFLFAFSFPLYLYCSRYRLPVCLPPNNVDTSVEQSSGSSNLDVSAIHFMSGRLSPLIKVAEDELGSISPIFIVDVNVCAVIDRTRFVRDCFNLACCSRRVDKVGVAEARLFEMMREGVCETTMAEGSKGFRLRSVGETIVAEANRSGVVSDGFVPETIVAEAEELERMRDEVARLAEALELSSDVEVEAEGFKAFRGVARDMRPRRMRLWRLGRGTSIRRRTI